MHTTRHRLLAAAVLALSLSAACPVLRAQPAPALPPTAGSAAATMSDGEVRKVDKGARKITLKHGEIRNLDMPPMTMVFGVRDPAMLEQLKAGQKVRFRAVEAGGQLTIVEIQAVP